MTAAAADAEGEPGRSISIHEVRELEIKDVLETHAQVEGGWRDRALTAKWAEQAAEPDEPPPPQKKDRVQEAIPDRDAPGSEDGAAAGQSGGDLPSRRSSAGSPPRKSQKV